MNPTDFATSESARLEQFLEMAQRSQWAMLAFAIAALLLLGLIVYSFYARLCEIAVELKKLRIAFEMSEDAKSRLPLSTASKDDEKLTRPPK